MKIILSNPLVVSGSLYNMSSKEFIVKLSEMDSHNCKIGEITIITSSLPDIEKLAKSLISAYLDLQKEQFYANPEN
jgi:hypothetical protein